MNPYLYNYLASMKKILLLVPFYNLGLTIRMMIAWTMSIRSNFKEAARIYEERKNEIILQWLEKRYGYLVPEIITPPKKKSYIQMSLNTYLRLLMAGTDCLPGIVRMCINSIKKNSVGREVVMITKDNIRK